MPNKNRYKTIKLAVFSGLLYAGGMAFLIMAMG
jgi:predicted branched-subunit amino acid permease